MHKPFHPSVPPCGRPPQHPVHFGDINYTAEQINALLGMIPYKADRAEVPQMEKLSDVNYVGHVADASLLTEQERPSWALVGDIKAAKPYFFYVDGFVPQGYTAGWNDVSGALGTYDLTADKISIYDFNLVTEYNVSRNHKNTKREFSGHWGATTLYYPEYEDYKPCKLYEEGDKVNMPGYTEHSFVAIHQTERPPFEIVSETRSFTFEEAMALVPEEFRFPGIRVTYVDSNTGLAVTWVYLGGEWAKQSSWVKPAEGNISITNFPDEEDLTSTNEGSLKLKDKAYAPENYSGLGKVYLRKNMVSGVNMLTQNMLQDDNGDDLTNTRFIIQYNYSLSGDEITIPEGCVLDFQGGSLSNGSIVGNNTSIISNNVQIFNLSLNLLGDYNVHEWYLEWFGYNGGDAKDYLLKYNSRTIKLLPKTYYVSSVVLGPYTKIIGSGIGQTIIKQLNNSTGTCICFENWYKGEICDLEINGEDVSNYNTAGFEDSLLKVRTNKATVVSSLMSYQIRVHDISIKRAPNNGISYLGNNDIDGDITCHYNWVIHTTNVYIHGAKRYGFYNNSSDNKFLNIYCSESLYCQLFEVGGSNVWSNVKIDGPLQISGYSLEDIVNSDILGAGLIVKGDVIAMSNVDIQSCPYVGAKLQGSNNNFKLSFNNCACMVVELSDRIKNCPTLILNTLRYSNIEATFNKYSNQRRMLAVKGLISNYNNITISSDYSHSNKYDANVIDTLKKNNNVVYSSIDSVFNTSSCVTLNNLFDDKITEDSSKYTASEVNTSTPIFGTTSIKFKDGKSKTKSFVLDKRMLLRTNHVYLALAICRTNVASTVSAPTSKIPYFNIIDPASEINIVSVSNDPYTQDMYNEVNSNFFIYYYFSFPSANIETVSAVVRMYYIADGDYDVDNFCLYDLTDSLGVSNVPPYNDSSMSLFSLFANTAYSDANVEFSDIVLENNLNNRANTLFGKYDTVSSIKRTGTTAYFTDIKRLAHFNGEKWVDNEEYDVLFKHKGTTEEMPLLPYNYKGFDYYNTDLNIELIWGGDNWISSSNIAVNYHINKNTKIINLDKSISAAYLLSLATPTTLHSSLFYITYSSHLNAFKIYNLTENMPDINFKYIITEDKAGLIIEKNNEYFCSVNLRLLNIGAYSDISSFILSPATEEELSESLPINIIVLHNNNYGISSNRPEDALSGVQYFDTTLNKPIWWTGTAWVDASGIEV